MSLHSTPGSEPILKKIMPEMPMDDVSSGALYYCGVLGFHVNYQQADIAVLDRDDVRVLLISRTEKHTGIGSAYVYVSDADALYAELAAKGAMLQGEPVSHPWGLRDFSVRDTEGNVITFGQPLW